MGFYTSAHSIPVSGALYRTSYPDVLIATTDVPVAGTPAS